MQRLIVQRGDDHQFELINATDFKGRAKGDGQGQPATAGPRKPQLKNDGQAKVIPISRKKKGSKRLRALTPLPASTSRRVK